jgi:hypothetical protein
VFFEATIKAQNQKQEGVQNPIFPPRVCYAIWGMIDCSIKMHTEVGRNKILKIGSEANAKTSITCVESLGTKLRLIQRV